MKYILSLIISGALVVSGFGQTRNVLVGTNNTVIQPTNFWSADASNARTGLGLGTAATNPASAFQPTSSALTNLASGNGGALTNLQATNIVGLIPSSNIPSVTFTNLSGTLSIAQGGTGATNAANARQNLGSTTVGDSVFTATNAAAARTAIGALTSNSDGSGLTNLTAANITGTVALASNLSSPLALTNGGTGATNAETARTNLGLGWSALTNTDATNFRNAIGLGTTNNVLFNSVTLGDFELNVNNLKWGGSEIIELETRYFLGEWTFDSGAIQFGGGTNRPLYQAQTRTNLGIPWSGLTNTNAATFQTALFGANTNPVLVDTNGEVVSPTNFWQAAPITTTFIESQPTTNFTTNITAARFLHIHSLNTNIVNVTNTIALPTNGSTYNGDIALVVHQGPTNSMTRVRAVGSTNDIITMTRYNEAIEFVYYNNAWQFNHNEAFTEPIYFAGTNAAGHAAESRTNLGLGNIFTNTYQTTNTAVFINTNLVVTNSAANFVNIESDYIESPYFQVADGTNGIDFETDVVRDITLTNLGFGLNGTNAFGARLIKSSISNLVITDFQNDQAIITFPADTDPVVLDAAYWDHAAVRTSLGLGTTNNVSFSNVTASGTLTATGTVTATTNLVVNGFVDFSTNHTNVAPATNNQIQKFLQIRIGTNAYFLPLYQ